MGKKKYWVFRTRTPNAQRTDAGIPSTGKVASLLQIRSELFGPEASS